MSRHDERGHHDGHDEHDEHDLNDEHASHAGNGTVNHGPDEQGQGPEGRGGERGPGRQRLEALVFGAHGSGGPGDEGGPDGLGSDELALRTMLHQAVQEIEPKDGTLEHLRRAVPARRARKRHAVVGMAAAALFIGTAIPALVHVSNATGSDADPSMAGNSSQAQGGATQDKGSSSGSNSSSGSGGSSKGTGKGSGKHKGDTDKGATSGATGPVATASAEGAPACTAAQLGGSSASVASPDSTGTVYGSFRVANVSGTSCTVTGAGSVAASAQGAADPSKVLVADHAAGDGVAGLPDPSLSAAQMVLQPGAAYVVKFAWVPSETCPTTNDPDPSPDPSPTDNTTDSGGTTDGSSSGSGSGSGVAPQLLREDGVADGSVVVSHTTAAGTATSPTTVPNACAGTVYRTGLLSGS
ncbi:hypothetical protein [Streptomyces sp. NPDC046862]|uniref:hypothetical protein n=1 Tax=Streptomyces sp. NPDC046862 TaxID=3154603 RepID=UPI00345221F5